MDKTELFVCQCEDVSHQMILSTLEGEKDIYGTFHLDNYGLWNRVKSAFGYILDVNRRDGDFAPLLFKLGDTNRLQDIISVIAPRDNASKEECCHTPRVYEQKNTGNTWKITEHYSWQFNSLDILYTWAVETHECLTNATFGKDLEVVITPTLIQRPFAARIYHAIRHVFGFRSRFGDFDSFEWTAADATKLTAMIHSIRHNSEK